MPGRAQADDGGDVVDRAHDRRDAVEVDRDDPHRLARRRARRSPSTASRRRSSPPAAAPSGTKNDATSDRGRGGHRPERQHVEPRERHVARADQQRHAEVAEAADQDRRHGEEDHDRAVHREQRRVRGRRDHAARRRRTAAGPRAARADPGGRAASGSASPSRRRRPGTPAPGTGTASRSPCGRPRRRAAARSRSGLAATRRAAGPGRRAVTGPVSQSQPRAPSASAGS